MPAFDCLVAKPKPQDCSNCGDAMEVTPLHHYSREVLLCPTCGRREIFDRFGTWYLVVEGDQTKKTQPVYG